MRRILSALFAGLLLASLCCTGQMAGGGTETTNGISGKVARAPDSMSEDVRPVIAAIYSIEYRPDSGTGIAETTVVDTKGNFHFDPPPENRYNLFMWDTSNSRGVYLPMLPADTALGTIELTRTTTLTLLPNPVSWGVTEIKYELIISGSPFYYRTASTVSDTGEKTIFPYVPDGAYTLNVHNLLPRPSDGPSVNTDKKITINSSKDQDTLQIMVP